MDEEQPKKKITLNNFFEQIVEIDKVANAALTNSNMVQSQLNAIQLDLKRLIESLQVNFDSGVQNVQTQINEVTNVIVQEQEIKKSENIYLFLETIANNKRLDFVCYDDIIRFTNEIWTEYISENHKTNAESLTNEK